MLSRASKKRLQREAYNSWQKSRESLILPWLCPTPIWARPARKTSTTAPSRSAKRPKPVQTCLATSNLKITKETPRRLASAAAIKYDTPDDHFVPFERTAPTYNQLAINELSWHEQDTPSALRNFDPASPMIIKETLATKQQRFRAKNAMSGAVSEIISTLRACIQVGRLRRAAALMRRLNEIYKPDTSELILMHNDYLWELVSRAKQTKDQAILKEIYKWFEVDLTGGGVIPDATTYALMVQAALQGIKSKNLDRTIKRYMALADESGLRDAVMQTLLRTLDEQDIGRITQVCQA